MTQARQRDNNPTRVDASAPDLGADLIKICGLRETDHAVAAARAGADLLGFIFAPARRQVTPEAAGEAIAAARAAAPDRMLLAVGVFVDATAEEINRTARIAGLDLAQLHGDEPPALLGDLEIPVFKGVRPRSGTTVEDVDADLRRYDSAGNAPVLYHLEGYSAAGAGGVGAQADWSLAREVAAHWPVILAGGLNPDNVGDAIQTVRPRAVDVSSGVERDGVKDVDLIAAFIANARQAFASSPASVSGEPD